MIKTPDRTYFFFAKSDVEREVWVESFKRIIEMNKKVLDSGRG